MANLHAQCQKGKGSIKLKVDILTPEPHIRLKSCSGNRIPCSGSIMLDLQRRKQSHHQKHKFCVVNVPGPATLGCSASTDLGIISVLTDATLVDDVKVTENHAEHHIPPAGFKVNIIEDLKWWYPNCFDKIGNSTYF